MRARLGWTAAVAVVSLPFVVTLCLILSRTPFPLTEAVAIFEDVEDRGVGQFFVPDTSYYRPVYYAALSTIWHGVDGMGARLALVRSIHVVAILALVFLLIAHLRPRGLLEAAAAAAAVAVLVGSPGFQDNLELPLSYTIVGMPLLLGVFMLLERDPRAWHVPLILGLTLIAVGFKEQGLVIVPVVVAAWWARAPGASRTTAIAVAAFAVVYVAVRLAWRAPLPMFEQAIGLGFSEITPDEAIARFGTFPYGVYAYNSVATMLNVLFSEPTRGTFRIVDAFIHLRFDWWPAVQLGSSAALTAIVGWWGWRALRAVPRTGWTAEARVAVALAVALLACGALSFNYSRDRLGGMATVLYAVAAFHALRAVAGRAAAAPRPRGVAGAVALMLLVALWHSRTFTTLEYARYTADVNQRQWLTMVPERRAEFARRQTYLDIMDAMTEQGIDPDAAHQTRYPVAVKRVLGLP